MLSIVVQQFIFDSILKANEHYQESLLKFQGPNPRLNGDIPTQFSQTALAIEEIGPDSLIKIHLDEDIVGLEFLKALGKRLAMSSMSEPFQRDESMNRRR